MYFLIIFGLKQCRENEIRRRQRRSPLRRARESSGYRGPNTEAGLLSSVLAGGGGWEVGKITH